MPAVIKIYARKARKLNWSGSRAASASFLTVSFGKLQSRSNVVTEAVDPVYDWRTRLEVDDDGDLLSTPLTFTLMQRERSEALGTIVLSLEALLSHGDESETEIDGWLPLHDTLHGLQGEVSIQVKVTDRQARGTSGALAGKAAESEDEVQFYAVSRLSYR